MLSLSGLAISGELPRASLPVALTVLPFLIGGLWAGIRVRGSLPRERFRHAVLAVCAVSAVVLIAKSLA